MGFHVLKNVIQKAEALAFNDFQVMFLFSYISCPWCQIQVTLDYAWLQKLSLYFFQKCYNFKFYIWIFELIVKMSVSGARTASKVGFLFVCHVFQLSVPGVFVEHTVVSPV